MIRSSHHSHLLAEDFNHILELTSDLWPSLKGNRIFISGGTGFFGSWLLQTLAWAIQHLHINFDVVVLSRDPDAFLNRVPYLREVSNISFIKGDILNFNFPEGNFSHIIHAATPVHPQTTSENPLKVFDVIVDGTRRVLDLAKQSHVKRFLLTSSGAVYGKQPSEITHIPEYFIGAPDSTDQNFIYGSSKRTAELLCSIYSEQCSIETVYARCFAFVGPYLPLDSHFAIGNFIKNSLEGKPIIVKGDGSPYRSYLYASDLMISLLTLLVRGQSRSAYNVGSEEHFTISEIAQKVANGQVPVEIIKKLKEGVSAERYVPSVQKIQNELNIKQTVFFDEAIQKTKDWNIKLKKILLIDKLL